MKGFSMDSVFFHFAIGHFTCIAIRNRDDWDRNILLNPSPAGRRVGDEGALTHYESALPVAVGGSFWSLNMSVASGGRVSSSEQG